MMAQKTVSGTVLSANDGSAIEMATVRLFTYRIENGVVDSTMLQGAQTSYDGMFVLTNIPKGKYKLHISSVGYSDFVHFFRTSA